ncbi:MAG: hypothetical protein BRD50_01170 [Bacteroidetes bacterium SW_11_45_7]|nr:MAG: hypothetical protein BRD50_01170 [Bacteroidetes bacterium SW_11_45_7]
MENRIRPRELLSRGLLGKKKNAYWLESLILIANFLSKNTPGKLLMAPDGMDSKHPRICDLPNIPICAQGCFDQRLTRFTHMGSRKTERLQSE